MPRDSGGAGSTIYAARGTRHATLATEEETMTATATPTPKTAQPAVPESFDNEFTRQFGLPVERVQTKVLGYLNADVQAFIGRSPFLVMATSDVNGRCDASPKGGRPGFVRVLDERHLLLPDVKGNRLFQSYLNMSANPQIGIVFFIPGSERTVRVNGRVRIVDA